MLKVSQTAVRLIAGAVLALALAAQAQVQSNPFPGKPLAAPQIHVERQSLFRLWRGGEVPLGDYMPSVFKRRRLGTVSLAENIQAHLDAIQNTEHLLHAFSYRFYKVEGANGIIYTMISRRKILSATHRS